MIYVGELFVTLKSRRWPYGQACHLFVRPETDIEELHEFAEGIGLRRTWFQNHSVMPHYDLTRNMRFQAIRAGAVQVDRDLESEIIKLWRKGAKDGKAKESKAKKRIHQLN